MLKPLLHDKERFETRIVNQCNIVFFLDLVLCGNVTKDARNIKENAKGATVKWNIIPSKNEILVNTHVYLRREQGDTLVVTSYPIALVTSKGNEIFESGLSAKCYVNHINATSLRDKVYELEIQRLNENRNLTFVLTGFFRNLNDGIVRTDEDMTIIILKGMCFTSFDPFSLPLTCDSFALSPPSELTSFGQDRRNFIRSRSNSAKIFSELLLI